MCASSARVFRSQSEAETVAFGRRLGALLAPGDLVLLLAPFGAGKTHLTKGIAAAWGIDTAEVNSPSYVLVNEYTADAAHGRIPLYHADLYRIESASDLATVGLEAALDGDGICVIEWAERAAGWLPDEHLAVQIEVTGEQSRLIGVEAHGARYEALVKRLPEQGSR